jgi:hypothetical protein
MPSLAVVSRWEGVALMGGFCLAIAWQLLAGRIRLDGLLCGDRQDGERYFSAGRAQYLAVTLFVAGQFVLRVIQDPARLPTIPNAALALLGGSAALYLAEKAWATLLSGPTDDSTRRTP